MDVELTKQLISKGINVLTNIIKLYESKSRNNEKITPDDFLQTFKGVTIDDLKWATQLLQNTSPRKGRNSNSISNVLNERPKFSSIPSHGATIEDQTPVETAKNLLSAIQLTALSNSKTFPSADKLIETLQIKDDHLKQKFRKEYEQTVPLIKKTIDKHPVDTELIFWAKMGKVLFYSGVVVAVLILIIKVYELFVDFTDFIRKKISKLLQGLTNVIRPSGSRWRLRIWHWLKTRISRKNKQPKNKRSSSSPIKGNNILNLNFNGDKPQWENIQGKESESNDNSSDESDNDDDDDGDF